MTDGSVDRKRLEEIFEINRHFLDLIVSQWSSKGGKQYGLPADLCERIQGLNQSQREIVATVPLLMVTATRGAVENAGHVRDMEQQQRHTFQKNEVSEQVFNATLMTWLTQDAQQEHSLSSLWLGTSDSGDESVRELNFGDIQSLAPFAGSILHARFADRPNVWKDLIRAAESNDPQRQQIARLAVLPHSYPIPKKPRSLRWRKRRK